MFDALHPIDKDEFKEFVKTWPHSLVVCIYSVSKFHEKFHITQICLNELERRGFTKREMEDFCGQVEEFYTQMLQQNDL